jgi:predicted phosphodiesterase
VTVATLRLAVLSDIHGNLPALRAVLAQIDAEHIEQVVNLGDVVSGPLWPRETADRLMGLGWPTIAGNHERQALAARPSPSPAPGNDDGFAAAELSAAQRAWLQSLPPTLRALDGAVLLVHGTPHSDLQALLETVSPGHQPGGDPGVRAASAEEIRQRLGPAPGRAPGHPAADRVGSEVLLCGHTHVPRVVMLDGRLLVNPGSVGRPAYSHDQPYPHRVETGSPHARWAVLEQGNHGWQVQLRATAYDWHASADRAARLGFADWAHELRSGRTAA